jgi:acetyl esterase/lipase
MLMAYDVIPGRENVDKVEWFPLSGGATALKGFPRTYIIHTDKEACRDDGVVMQAALNDADVPVKLDILTALLLDNGLFTPHRMRYTPIHNLCVKGIPYRIRYPIVDEG